MAFLHTLVDDDELDSLTRAVQEVDDIESELELAMDSLKRGLLGECHEHLQAAIAVLDGR